MVDIFKEALPSILQTKAPVFHDDIDYKDYAPFIMNRALSHHLDCIPYVLEMDRYSFLDKDMQYQYYMHSIRAMKRKYQPWMKASIVQDLECVKAYFGYSNQKAKDALLLLTEDQIDQIKENLITGGLTK